MEQLNFSPLYRGKENMSDKSSRESNKTIYEIVENGENSRFTRKTVWKSQTRPFCQDPFTNKPTELLSAISFSTSYKHSV